MGKRVADMTPEQIEAQREYVRRRHANRTPEQIETRREYGRRYHAAKKAKSDTSITEKTNDPQT